MQYAVLIYKKWDDESDLHPEMLERYGKIFGEAKEKGLTRGGAALQPVMATTTVRVRDDEVLLTDGPFLESKEQLSGFQIFECDSLDEAIEWAAKLPDTETEAVEVRPLLSPM